MRAEQYNSIGKYDLPLVKMDVLARDRPSTARIIILENNLTTYQLTNLRSLDNAESQKINVNSPQ